MPTPYITTKLDKYYLTLSLLISILVISWVLYYCQFGFDFTDEGYYLSQISNPFAYKYTLTQFGFIYYPLNNVLDGNIVYFRQANLIITFMLGWMLSFCFLKQLLNNPLSNNYWLLIMSASFATTTLVYPYAMPTPSYNYLNLQGLMIFAFGMLLADKKTTNSSLIGWTLIGIGGFLTFMAKPSTAIALVVYSIIFLPLLNKMNFRLASYSLLIALSLLWFSAILIDGSIIFFFDRLEQSYKMTGLLNAGHTITKSILRFFEFKFMANPNLIIIFSILTISTAVITFLVWSGKKTLSFFHGISITIIATFNILIILNILISPFELTFYNDYLIYFFPAAVILFMLSVRLRGFYIFIVLFIWIIINVGIQEYLLYYRVLEHPYIIFLLFSLIVFVIIYFHKQYNIFTNTNWRLTLSFIFIPAIYSFGTNANYYLHGTQASIFLILASLPLLQSINVNQKILTVILTLTFAVQFSVINSINIRIQHPFRQPVSFLEKQQLIELGNPTSQLSINIVFADYIEDVISKAKQAGFKKGTGVIDLTGRSPGLLYAIGAKNVGTGWLQGGYYGSDTLAKEALNRVSCDEIAEAWVLYEKTRYRMISPKVLQFFGADINTDYSVAGTFDSPKGAGGYKESFKQFLFKPARNHEDALLACKVLK